MTAQELFKAGRLADAIEAQTQHVKGKPADQDARFDLFSLLCFAGELERAEKQLDVLATQDERARSGSLVYRQLLASELERRRVYAGASRPVLPPDPPGYVDKRLQALAHLHADDVPGAERCVDEAVEASAPIRGVLNQTHFTGARDYDDVLGTVLEVFAGGRYLWLPFEHVRRLEVEEPRTALDTLWLPARLDDAHGESASVHLPVLYAGSQDHPDEAIRLGRRTEWRERGELYLGVGQRQLLTASEDDTTEHELLSVRELRFEATN